MAAVLEAVRVEKARERRASAGSEDGKGQGVRPDCVYDGVLFSLTRGGCSLKEVEALNEDEALKSFLDGTLQRARSWPDVVADLRSRDAATLWSGSTARGAVVTKR